MGKDPATTPVIIYTDGACDPNPGPGGWAAILLFDAPGKERAEKQLTGQEAGITTNNRMELQAAIEALKALKRPCVVHLCTDSTYLKNGIIQWLPGWKKRGWQSKSGDAIKNMDLWQLLDQLCQQHRITWQWVKAHRSELKEDAEQEHRDYNNKVDELAHDNIPRLTLPTTDSNTASIFIHAEGRGWATIVRVGDKEHAIKGIESQGQLLDKEMKAVIEGLRYSPEGYSITIYSINNYLRNHLSKKQSHWSSSSVPNNNDSEGLKSIRDHFYKLLSSRQVVVIRTTTLCPELAEAKRLVKEVNHTLDR